MKLASAEVASVAGLVMDLCGILLDESKGYLIESRLAPIAQHHGLGSYTELVQKARVGYDQQLLKQIVDAITTNETLFFRDESPFEALRHKAIPELIDAKSKTAFPRRLRIWSAACSTGQEPYSIAMTLHELIPDIHAWDISIHATDICDAAIEQASMGTYSAFEVERGMKPQYLDRFLVRHNASWKVRDEVRALVSFQNLNLMQPLMGLGPFDVVFCRNVAIYFTPEGRRNVFQKIAQTMTRDGYLFVGCAESLADMGPQYTPHHHCRGMYYRPNLPALGDPARASTAASTPVRR
ncbi:MAG: protein-glutamate O-methyltransferase CheR [Planctomycetia bacterium]|nr:protein-glutamate O-methyltransferase CheR [Planctomycetia bacterium]